jgi:hypothetical protein
MTLILSRVNERRNCVPFNSRHIEIHHSETFPKQLLNSIKNNKPLDEFVRAGNPKTFWEKFKNLFQKEEYIDFYYDTYPVKSSVQAEELVMDMSKYSKKNGWLSLGGLRIKANSKPSNPITPTERILKEFESIKDFKQKLNPNFDIIEV